jgi:hypothetical protein
VAWRFLKTDDHELDQQKKLQNARMEESEAFLGVLPGAVELAPDAQCEKEMALVARIALGFPLAVLSLLGLLWILLWRRLAMPSR